MQGESSEITARVAKNIVAARKAAGLRQTDIAEALGVSGRSVVKWEKGLSDPTNANLSRLGSLLGLPGKGLWFYQDHDENALDPMVEQWRRDSMELAQIRKLINSVRELPADGAVTIHYALAQLSKMRAGGSRDIANQADLLIQSIRAKRDIA